jgi:hypothetical protein
MTTGASWHSGGWRDSAARGQSAKWLLAASDGSEAGFHVSHARNKAGLWCLPAQDEANGETRQQQDISTTKLEPGCERASAVREQPHPEDGHGQ